MTRWMLLPALLLAAAAASAQSPASLVGSWAVARYVGPDSTATSALEALLPQLAEPATNVLVVFEPGGRAEITVIVSLPDGFLLARAEGAYRLDGDRLDLSLHDPNAPERVADAAFTVRAEGDGWALAGADGSLWLVPDPLASGDSLSTIPADE